VTSLGGAGIMAKSHASRFFTRANNNFVLPAQVNKSFNEEDEITRLLQKNIAEIKKDIKLADAEKTGTIKDTEFLAMMRKYQIKIA
jgi:hypothetical protein